MFARVQRLSSPKSIRAKPNEELNFSRIAKRASHNDEPRRFRFRLLCGNRTTGGRKRRPGDSGNRFSRFGRQGDHSENGLIIIRMQYRDAGVSGVSSEKIALERFANVDYHSRRKNTPETVLVIDIRITATITADITDRGISSRDMAWITK